MYSPRKGRAWGWRDYHRELVLKIPIHVTQFCVKNPLDMPSNLDMMHLRSPSFAKVVCQIPEGSDCFGFGCLIPKGMPAPLPL